MNDPAEENPMARLLRGLADFDPTDSFQHEFTLETSYGREVRVLHKWGRVFLRVQCPGSEAALEVKLNPEQARLIALALTENLGS